MVIAAGVDREPDGRPTRHEVYLLEAGKRHLLLELQGVVGVVRLAMDEATAWVSTHEGLGARMRAIDLVSRRQTWEREIPGDVEIYQAESGGRVGLLTLDAVGPEFRWLDEGPYNLPGQHEVPLGLSFELPSKRGCDVANPRTDQDRTLAEAQDRYHARDWAGVRAVLARLKSRPEHADHLDGAAALLAGDLGYAEQMLARFARSGARTCDLGGLLPLAAARFKLARPGVTGVDPRFTAALEHHVDAVQHADAALARGNGSSAWIELSTVPCWHTDDAQLAARRVEAAIAARSSSPLPLLRALQSLALASGDVPGVESWSTERIEEIAARGREVARSLAEERAAAESI
jgi:hypothetical protein